MAATAVSRPFRVRRHLAPPGLIPMPPPDALLDDLLLRQALSGAADALPRVCADPRAEQTRLEGLLAGAEQPLAPGLVAAEAGDVNPGDVNPGDVNPGDVNPGDVNPGDIELLADLLVAQGQVAAGTAQPPSPAVLEAVCSAFDAALHADAVGSVVAAAPAREAAAIVPGVGLRLLASRPRGRAAPPAAWWPAAWRSVAAVAAVLVAAVGTWSFVRSVDSPSGASRGGESSVSLDANELASLRRTLEDTPASAGERAQVAPFVEARLWRRVTGSALRGGEGLGLRQGAEAGAAGAAGEAPADVVLSWLPDAASGAAARLRVHVTGPQGLVVALPDLGVEARLPGQALPDPAAEAGAEASRTAPATYVDLELPGGWAGRLPEHELRLAFRWPDSAGGAFPSPNARFTGVSLASPHAVEGS